MTHDPSRVRISGPLQPFAPAFVKWLTRQGYTRVAATFQLQFVAHLSRWLADEHLEPARLSMTAPTGSCVSGATRDTRNG